MLRVAGRFYYKGIKYGEPVLLWQEFSRTVGLNLVDWGLLECVSK